MNIKQDIAAGALFIFAGIAGLVFGASLDIGSLAQIGPGFAPKVISVGLIGLGVAVGYRGRNVGVQLDMPHLRPVVTVLGGLVLFTVLVRVVGLFPTVVATTFFLSTLGGNRRPWEALIVGTVFAAALVGVFIYGLKLPVQVFWW